MSGRLRDQGGFSIIELLVGIIGFVIVFSVIMEMVVLATHNQDRISQRVAANQRARPVVTRILDGLRSACVYPRVVPVATGSTGTQINFISKSGSSVTPVPDRRVISLSGSNLNETVYPPTGGTPPTWTFSGTPSSNRTLMTNVTAPPGGIFRYHDYVNGALNPTSLPVPLSASNAARVAYVSVNLTVQPARGLSSLDAKSPITISGATDLLLESASPITAQDNLPCS